MPDSGYNSRKISTFLNKNRTQILDVWKKRLREEVPPAKHQSEPMLLNSLPIFMQALARTFDPQSATEDPCEEGVCWVHGQERASMALYSIEATLKEYSILRQVLIEALEEAFELRNGDRDIVLLAVDMAMQEASAAFSSSRHEKERHKTRKAEGLLQELESERGQREHFVSTLSHDLRGPLGVVQMALEMLLEEIPESDAVSELSGIMTRNLKQSDLLISNLLDVNRLKSGGKLPLHIEYFEMREVIAQIVEDLSVVNGKSILLKGDKQKIHGYWSRNHIHRLTENLISNAIKYGAITTPVEVALYDAPATVTIAVHNQGSIIAEADQVALFEPYFRTDNAQFGKTLGWGLGLTIVKGVAEAHGGHAGVKSSLEEGTTFIVTLPKDAREIQGQD